MLRFFQPLRTPEEIQKQRDELASHKVTAVFVRAPSPRPVGRPPKKRELVPADAESAAAAAAEEVLPNRKRRYVQWFETDLIHEILRTYKAHRLQSEGRAYSADTEKMSACRATTMAMLCLCVGVVASHLNAGGSWIVRGSGTATTESRARHVHSSRRSGRFAKLPRTSGNSGNSGTSGLLPMAFRTSGDSRTCENQTHFGCKSGHFGGNSGHKSRSTSRSRECASGGVLRCSAPCDPS